MNAWNKLGLQWKLQILIQGFLILILVGAQIWITRHFEQQILHAAEHRARTVADGTINGLNTLMITKAGGEEVISDKNSRAQFIDKMGKSEDIRELRVFRAKQMDSEFPAALPQEIPVDALDRKVLETGKEQAQIINNGANGALLRTVVPFIAMKEYRSIKCLKCHGVSEGFALGGASVSIDIGDDLATVRRMSTMLWIGQGVLQVLLFFGIGYIVSRLVKQLGGEPAYVIDIVRKIAKGNLSEKIRTRPGDTTSLLAATLQMQEGLRGIVGGILHDADELTHAAHKLGESSGALQKAAERQQDSSASVAASVEQMTVCINQISDNAAEAERDVTDTGSRAQEGNAKVREVIGEMGLIAEAVKLSSTTITALGEQSHRISNIINVIKEIADQTNLLALNAAIEAARAGEQGRGFAVVADEVRKLAERTTQSTQEIAAMIVGIQGNTDEAVVRMAQGISRVEEGVQMVGVTGNAMEQIQHGVQKVLTSIGVISAALREQSSSSALISDNVQTIAEMNEQNSAIINDASTSATRLEHLAEELKRAVGVFKL